MSTVPKYISVGATDAVGEPIKTKQRLIELLTHNPRTVRFYATKLTQAGQTVFNGSEITTDRVFIVSGPDAFKERLWTCQVKLVSGKVAVI